MTNLDRFRSSASFDRPHSAYAVSDTANRKWLTGFSGSFGIALVGSDFQVLLTDSRYTLQAAEQADGWDVRTYASPTKLEDFLAATLAEIGIEFLAFESANTTYETFEKWSAALPGVTLEGADSLVAKLRMVKSPDELARVKAACRLADACFEHVLRLIRPGAVEFDIGLEIEFFFRRSGADLAFAPIVVSGERSARPHGRASEKVLQDGDLLTLDFGAELDGYCSDITRTVVVGSIGERHRKIYEAVLSSQEASLAMMRPGVPAREVDAEARRVMGEYAEYFGHGLGHGLGSVVHDTGRLSATSEDVLEPGQVWTVEPGTYIPGFGGVRIEDDVVVTDAGIEILTHSPKQLMALPR